MNIIWTLTQPEAVLVLDALSNLPINRGLAVFQKLVAQHDAQVRASQMPPVGEAETPMAETPMAG